MRDSEWYCDGLGSRSSIDIDDLFDESTTAKKEPSTPSQKVKDEPQSSRKNVHEDDDMLPPAPPPPAKPKKGRLISNERPLEDFNRLIEGEGDVFRKAIQDLGAVVEENVAGSFSSQAFPLAIDCLKAMRSTALMYEEVETWNE